MPDATDRTMFTPLKNISNDDNSDYEDEEEVDLEGELNLRRRVEGGGWRRAFIWSLCSATTIYTTKNLMVDHGFHYPLTIAFRFFIVAFIIYNILLRVSIESTSLPGTEFSNWTSRQDDFLPNRSWLIMMPASLAAAASLPMLLEGLLHMPSLPVLIMIFPLVYAIELLILFICCSTSDMKEATSRKPAEPIIVMIASALILYNEYRLMVPGLICGVGGILVLGLARALFVLGRIRSNLAQDSTSRVNHSFVVMTLAFGIAISGCMAYSFEDIDSVWPIRYSTIGLMVLNLVAMIGAAFSGTSIFVYSPLSFEDSTDQVTCTFLRVPGVIASAASSTLLLVVAMLSTPISVVSWTQITVYLFSLAFTLGFDDLNTLCQACLDNTQRKFSRRIIYETRKPSPFTSTVMNALAIIIVASTLTFLSAFSLASLSPSRPTTYDTAYNSSERFEIVVSMYQEPPTDVAEMLAKIKSTSLLSTLDPKVTIYTKDPDADLSSIQLITGADRIIQLPNLGREGGTYLSHIVDQWDELAEQTMFIQAHAHNIRELIPRINDYLVNNTGMLSLGFPGVTCACGQCEDRWGWEDRFEILPALYERVYGQECDPEEQILLSYKGQFVASAKRIRGVEKNVYHGLLAAITSEEDWVHNGTFAGVERSERMDEDSPSNPAFGFTMERVWGLVMQCATGGNIASKCPSLLSGMGRGESVEDCQCLDVR